jgi:spore germination cell wall hydrolase CwlJ-like protein
MITMRFRTTYILLFSLVFVAGFSQPSANIHEKIRILELDDDVYCHAQNLYFETSGEPYKGKVAVIFVVSNRVKDQRWPNNVCEVIWQKKWKRKKKRFISQFSWTTDGKSDTPRNVKEWYQSLVIAQAWQNNKLRNTIGNATHYHSVTVKPWWRKKYKHVASIGRHIFYK